MKRKFVITIIIFSLLFLPGCWDRREPEDLAIVVGLGIDYNPETDMYKVSVEIINPQAVQGEGGGGQNDASSFWIVSAWGHTPLDALANVRKKVTRRIHYSHVVLELYSEKFARKKGLIPILDVLERTRQTRAIIIPAVVKGNVEKVLSKSIPIETSNIMGLLNQVNLTEQELGSTVQENIRILFNKLSQPGIDPVITGLKAIDEEDKGKKPETKANKPPPVEIDRTAVFNKDKMVGWLNVRETRGYNWITGKPNRAIVNFKYSEKKGNIVTVNVNEITSHIEPTFERGQPGIKLDVQASAKIVNFTGITRIKEKSALTVSLNRRLAQVIRNDIKMAIKKAQSLKSDIFGFGNSFYRLKYQKWQDMKDKWNTKFASLPVKINVKANIKRTGLVNKGIKPR